MYPAVRKVCSTIYVLTDIMYLFLFCTSKVLIHGTAFVILRSILDTVCLMYSVIYIKINYNDAVAAVLKPATSACVKMSRMLVTVRQLQPSSLRRNNHAGACRS